jgi:hypothetical protein
LHKVEVFERGEVGEALEVLDLVEGEVERNEVGEGVEALDVADEVVVKVDFGEGWGKRGRNGDGFETILAEAETLVGWSGGGGVKMG